jgi:hypothetical protein
MKTHTSEPDEDLGAIAAKFGLPSWKYLYQLNKDKIGDNPDLLKEGTVLKIPQWDSTGGDEKIEAKGANALEYTGGLRYAYPWAPFSFTIADNDKNKAPDFDKEREIVVHNIATKQVIQRDTIKMSDSFEKLIPDSKDIRIGIEGFPLEKDGKQHRHPNDEF